jgi:hypothetical protein
MESETEIHLRNKSSLPIRPVLLALLVLAAVLPYAGTLRYDFVWDDHYIVAHVEKLSQSEGLPAVLSAPFFPHPGVPDKYYRPVVYLSIWLDHRLGGGSPQMFHLTNILLNLVCVLLCAILFRKLIPDDFAAFIGSLLFALHPTHVESVAFISGRTDLLAAMFILLAVLAWRKSHDVDREQKPRPGMLAGSALAFLLASLSKENAVLLPVLLIAWDRWGASRRAAPVTGWWRRNSPWMGLYGLMLAVFFALRIFMLHPVPGEPGPLENAGPLLLDQPGVAALGLLQSIRMLLVPWPHNALYTRQHIAPDVLSFLAAGAACALIAWTFAHRFDRTGRIGGGWIAVFLAPSVLLPSVGVVVTAERFLYLPSLGFCLVVSCLLSGIPNSNFHRKAAVVAVAIGALALGGADFHRAGIWRNDIALGTDLVRTSPDSGLAQNRLGQGLLAAGRYSEAFEPLRKAVSLEPFNAAYYNDLGIALRRLNQSALAVHSFRQSLQIAPNVVGTRLNLAYACITLGDMACVAEQRKALESIDPQALAILDQVLERRRR